MAFDTVLNKIMATASFTIPSPKTNENSFGCSSYFMIDIAAITSEEQRRELMTKHSAILSIITFYSLKSQKEVD